MQIYLQISFISPKMPQKASKSNQKTARRSELYDLKFKIKQKVCYL